MSVERLVLVRAALEKRVDAEALERRRLVRVELAPGSLSKKFADDAVAPLEPDEPLENCARRAFGELASTGTAGTRRRLLDLGVRAGEYGRALAGRT